MRQSASHACPVGERCSVSAGSQGDLEREPRVRRHDLTALKCHCVFSWLSHGASIQAFLSLGLLACRCKKNADGDEYLRMQGKCFGIGSQPRACCCFFDTACGIAALTAAITNRWHSVGVDSWLTWAEHEKTRHQYQAKLHMIQYDKFTAIGSSSPVIGQHLNCRQPWVRQNVTCSQSTACAN